MNRHAPSSICCTAAAALVLAAALPAQRQPGDPLGPPAQDPQQQQPATGLGLDPQGILRPPSLENLPGQDPLDPQRLNSTWMRPEAFQGFPVFPPSLGSYGGYPKPPAGYLQPPDGAGPLPPPLPPEAPDWPAWVKQKRAPELPYDVGLAVLVRQSDRVWFRRAGDDAFVPLYHYDTVRGLPAGSDVRVPMTGEFLLLLYGGNRIESQGPAEAAIGELGEKSAAVTFATFKRLELWAPDRGIDLGLPDGSHVVVDPVPTDAVAAAKAGPAHLLIERRSEPGSYGGRATIFNSGDRPALWRTAFGDVGLEPGRRVTFFLSPPATTLPGRLVEDSTTATTDGVRRRWQTSAAAAVSWSGARFSLPAGTTLELDPLQGDPFGVPQGAAAAAPPEPAADQPPAGGALPDRARSTGTPPVRK